jgi:uncharacterized protein YbaR (Trm112 family)
MRGALARVVTVSPRKTLRHAAHLRDEWGYDQGSMPLLVLEDRSVRGLDGAVQARVARLARDLGDDLPCRVRAGSGGGAATVAVEVWRWCERMSQSARAASIDQALDSAFDSLAERMARAQSTGLMQGDLDVQEFLVRERVFGTNAFKGSGDLRFVFRMVPAEAFERLELTGRSGICFLDDVTHEITTALRFPELGGDEMALVRERRLLLDRFDGLDELALELEIVDASGAFRRVRQLRVPVLGAFASLDDALAHARQRSPGLFLGRDPRSGSPYLAWKSPAGRLTVLDFPTHNTDIDFALVEGFPPAELAPREGRSWREVLRCPDCESELPWSDGAHLACRLCGARFPVENGVPRFLVGSHAPQPLHDNEVWAPNPSPKVLFYFLLKHRGGLVLDCGAGNGSLRAPNLINLEVFPFRNTTLVADGERLPFRDGSIDAILSSAVLEHVADPFAYCAELRRVLKPGGEVRIDSAFLQPYHACPDHYFATTASGLRTAARGFRAVGLGVGPHQAPFVMLQTLLSTYARHIGDEEGRKRFLSTPVGELLHLPPGAGPLDMRLSPRSAPVLAAGFYLHGVKS